MFSGRIEAIFVAPSRGAPMRSVPCVRAVPGRGLEGDRYFLGAGSMSRWAGPKRELTLIAREDLAAMAADGVPLPASESRRNVLVSGVPLASLVREEFRLGAIRVRGVRLCQPCKYLARKTGLGVLPVMIGRGGLRAQILDEGVLQVGDSVLPLG